MYQRLPLLNPPYTGGNAVSNRLTSSRRRSSRESRLADLASMPADIDANLKTLLGDCVPEARYASFDYCYNHFQEARENGCTAQLADDDHRMLSCLQLSPDSHQSLRHPTGGGRKVGAGLAIPVLRPARLHAVDLVPAGQSVLAIPMDRGRLAARAHDPAYRCSRVAGPPSGGLNAMIQEPAATQMPQGYGRVGLTLPMRPGRPHAGHRHWCLGKNLAGMSDLRSAPVRKPNRAQRRRTTRTLSMTQGLSLIQARRQMTPLRAPIVGSGALDLTIEARVS